MAKYSVVQPHMTEEELLKKSKEVKGFWRVRQILVIINMMKGRQSASQLSSSVNLSSHRITKIIPTSSVKKILPRI